MSRKRLRLPEQLRGLARAARKQGWTIEYTNGCHFLWRSPAGVEIITAGTPSSKREKTNATVRLRRAGLKVG